MNNTPFTEQADIKALASSQTLKVQKHIILHEAIEEMVSVEQRATDLLVQITGEPPQPFAEEPTQQNPSLSVLLSVAPDRIKSHCDRVHQILTAISEKIF